MSAGVLNDEQLEQLLFDSKSPAWVPALASGKRPAIDGSAIDLPLGEHYWEMTASCRPVDSQDLLQLRADHSKSSHQLQPGTRLLRGRVYWLELQCNKIKLPPNYCGRATAKSSIGRLDAMVRLVVDRENEFDKISANGGGTVLLEVIPITFDLEVSPGLALSQLRIIHGDERYCSVPLPSLNLESEPVLVDRAGNRSSLKPFDDDEFAVPLSLDLSDDPKLGFAGFQAVASPDTPAINPANSDHYDPRRFWVPVKREGHSDTVQIRKEQFYIFRSQERFRIPEHLAVDCRAYSEGLGDIRIHYAGFAHPLFGKQNGDGSPNPKGAPLIFEVRGFTMDTILRNGATLAKVYFRRMSRPATKTDGSYSDQELKLSKVFRAWS